MLGEVLTSGTAILQRSRQMREGCPDSVTALADFVGSGDIANGICIAQIASGGYSRGAIQ